MTMMSKTPSICTHGLGGQWRRMAGVAVAAALGAEPSAGLVGGQPLMPSDHRLEMA